MRKIIVTTFITMDGIMQAPGGPEEDTSNHFKYGGWMFSFSDDVTNKAMQQLMSEPFDLLLGRRTYEIFSGYWPHHADNPIGELFNRINKYVVATTPLDTSWNNSILINEDVAKKIRQIKAQEGPALLVHGSSVLIQTLLAHDLIDELHTWTNPITLGDGKRLFQPGIPPQRWKVTDTIVSGTGVIIAKYVRDGEVPFGTVGE